MHSRVDSWTERPIFQDQNDYTAFFGKVTLVLHSGIDGKDKYSGEIKIYGSVVQTGTYYGTLDVVKEQIYTNACNLLEQAYQELTQTKLKS